MLTAAQAEATLPGRRKKYQVDSVPSIVRQMAKENRIYFHNVGTTKWMRTTPDGVLLIPACPAGERYVTAPRPIDGIVVHTTDVDGSKLENHTTDGLEVAKDVLGTGPHRASSGPFSDDLTRFGVFFSRNEVPTEEEIATATQHWHNYCATLVQQADQQYEVNGGVDAKSGVSNISDHHVAALKVLGWDRPWARKDVAQVLTSCPACGESIRPQSAMCKHCDAVLDEEKARKFFPHKMAALETARRSAVRQTKEV